MKTTQFITIFVLAASLLLSACSSSPTTAPQSTSAPVITTPGYPVPNAPGKPSTNSTQPTGYPAPDQSASQPTPAGYPAPGMGLRITAADGSAKMVDGNVLLTLVKSKVTLDGKENEVRKLSDALKAAGITTYNKISVNGVSGTLALTKDQAAQAYLDIGADGSIQLAVQGMSKDKWITGVQTMKVD
ncbi:MAG: hypothetical protein Q7U74_08145 [Saprospiraceae bacterium]|nr:hypothetical protein [Saprospiraceae bacterium]